MGEESNGRFKNQKNIEGIRERHEGAMNILVHQMCSEMLTMKKKVEDLEAEVKLNNLQHDDEMKDAYSNIAILMKRTEGKEQNMTDKEKAIKDLGITLFGDKNG